MPWLGWRFSTCPVDLDFYHSHPEELEQEGRNREDYWFCLFERGGANHPTTPPHCLPFLPATTQAQEETTGPTQNTLPTTLPMQFPSQTYRSVRFGRGPPHLWREGCHSVCVPCLLCMAFVLGCGNFWRRERRKEDNQHDSGGGGGLPPLFLPHARSPTTDPYNPSLSALLQLNPFLDFLPPLYTHTIPIFIAALPAYLLVPSYSS